MKIDFSSELTDIKGRPLPIKDGEDSRTMCLCDAALEALLTLYGDEQPQPDGMEKFRRYKLAVKVDGAGEVELEAEDVAKIKTLIAKRWPPLVVGRCYELIENGK
jgi:hypothetical protein